MSELDRLLEDLPGWISRADNEDKGILLSTEIARGILRQLRTLKTIVSVLDLAGMTDKIS